MLYLFKKYGHQCAVFCIRKFFSLKLRYTLQEVSPLINTACAHTNVYIFSKVHGIEVSILQFSHGILYVDQRKGKQYKMGEIENALCCLGAAYQLPEFRIDALKNCKDFVNISFCNRIFGF